jgi:hypothetical protein
MNIHTKEQGLIKYYLQVSVTIHHKPIHSRNPGVNPTTLSYNASSVKVNNATNSMERFRIKKHFPYNKTFQAYYDASVVVVN